MIKQSRLMLGFQMVCSLDAYSNGSKHSEQETFKIGPDINFSCLTLTNQFRAYLITWHILISSARLLKELKYSDTSFHLSTRKVRQEVVHLLTKKIQPGSEEWESQIK